MSEQATTALIEARLWLPRYRTTLVSCSGRTVASKHFWRRSKAFQWGYDYNERAASDVSKH